MQKGNVVCVYLTDRFLCLYTKRYSLPFPLLAEARLSFSALCENLPRNLILKSDYAAIALFNFHTVTVGTSEIQFKWHINIFVL